MYTATDFYELPEQLIKENIYLNKFFPKQSYFAESIFLEKDDLFEHLIKLLGKHNFTLQLIMV